MRLTGGTDEILPSPRDYIRPRTSYLQRSQKALKTRMSQVRVNRGELRLIPLGDRIETEETIALPGSLDPVRRRPILPRLVCLRGAQERKGKRG